MRGKKLFEVFFLRKCHLNDTAGKSKKCFDSLTWCSGGESVPDGVIFSKVSSSCNILMTPCQWSLNLSLKNINPTWSSPSIDNIFYQAPQRANRMINICIDWLFINLVAVESNRAHLLRMSSFWNSKLSYKHCSIELEKE